MEKVLKLSDYQLRKKSILLRWMILSVIVLAISISAGVYLFTDSLKTASIIPIILIPAFNLPLSLKLIRLEDERNRRIDKYEQLYSIHQKEKDLHLMN